MPNIKNGPKYTTINCRINGVPLNIDMYILKIQRSSQFFDMRPKATNSPSGSENNNVRVKIATDTSIPLVNSDINTDKFKTGFPPFQ